MLLKSSTCVGPHGVWSEMAVHEAFDIPLGAFLDLAAIELETKNENLTPDETKKMLDIQKSLSTLIDGGYIGKPSRMTEQKT